MEVGVGNFQRVVAAQLRKWASPEHGFALPVALGVTVILSLTAITVIESAASNSRAAKYSTSKQNAYSLAEAGLNTALSILNNQANNPMDPTLLSQRTTAYDTGTATWSGTLDSAPVGGGNPIWTITSTGSSRNAFGSQPATKTISAQAVVNPSPYFQTQQNQAWSYDYSKATGTIGGCDQVIWNTFGAPLYVSGNLCIDNNTTNLTTGWIQSGPILVQGQTTLKNAANKIQSATGGDISGALQVKLGCQYLVQVVHNPCLRGGPPNDNVWSGLITNTPVILPPPVADFDYWYVHAAPGPKVPCNPAKSSPPSTWPIFENETSNATRNNSVGIVDLTPATSYDCFAGNGSGGLPLGELKWDALTRKLYIIGTVYIDGSAKVTNAVVNTYTGWGSLYLSGTFLMQNSKLCAGVSDPACTFANNIFSMVFQMMLVVADGNGGQVPAGDSIRLSNSSFEGLLYGTNAIDVDLTSAFEGPAVASTLKFDGVVKPWTSTWFVPTGTPSNPQTSKTAVQPPKNFTG
jgi:Tfp pilus assembly protein PilX